jgi:hypothetical protein
MGQLLELCPIKQRYQNRHRILRSRNDIRGLSENRSPIEAERMNNITNTNAIDT